MNIKNQGVAFYFNVIAAVLGIAGVVCTAVSSSISTDNALTNLPMLMCLGILGIVLVCVAIYAPNRLGNHDIVSAVSVLGAIALFVYLFGNSVNQRIMMIAGLFSFNSGNTQGWTIFYICIAAWVCLLVSSILLVVGSFLKSVKE